MAPEVIQEIGYDCLADIWSLGITALEMAEGRPPYGSIHPMRAIFMIPTKPPPSFRDPNRWSSEFIDFVSRCLVKNPENRASAKDLLKHEFIRTKAQPNEFIRQMIQEANVIMENEQNNNNQQHSWESNCVIPDENSSTMVPTSTTTANGDGDDKGTLRGFSRQNSKTVPARRSNHKTNAVQSNHHNNQLVGRLTAEEEDEDSNSGNDRTMISDVESDLGTLIINSESEDEGDRTLKPSFMQQFERHQQQQQQQQHHHHQQQQQRSGAMEEPNDSSLRINSDGSSLPYPTADDNSMIIHSTAHIHPQQSTHPSSFVDAQGFLSTQEQQQQIQQLQFQHQQQQHQRQMAQISRNLMLEGDFEFLRNMPLDQLKSKMSNLDVEMEGEIEELRRRYAAKRQPILDAIQFKRSPFFWIKRLNF